MKKKLCPKTGFTLVELVVAIAVMAILASVVTMSGIAISNTVKNNRNVSAVESYYAKARAVMVQINGGTSIYGTNPQSNEIGELLKRAAGTKPELCRILDDTESNDAAKPSTQSDEGYYVAVRRADPSIREYNSSVHVEEKVREWFVEAVYLVQDGKVYSLSRTANGVEVTE